MSVQLVLLGFLKERDYYGYELKKEIQRRMEHWTDIKFGSIYHALKKLVEHDFVEVVGSYREKARPARTVYRITEAGKKEFERRLRELLGRIERVYLDFHIGLYFAGNLSREELDAVLDRRLQFFRGLIETLKGVRRMFISHGQSPINLAILENSLFHLEAEERWLEQTRKRLRDGELL